MIDIVRSPKILTILVQVSDGRARVIGDFDRDWDNVIKGILLPGRRERPHPIKYLETIPNPVHVFSDLIKLSGMGLPMRAGENKRVQLIGVIGELAQERAKVIELRTDRILRMKSGSRFERLRREGRRG